MRKGNSEAGLQYSFGQPRPCLGFGCGINGKGKKLAAADGWRDAGGTAVECGDDGGESYWRVYRANVSDAQVILERSTADRLPDNIVPLLQPAGVWPHATDGRCRRTALFDDPEGWAPWGGGIKISPAFSTGPLW